MIICIFLYVSGNYVILVCKMSNGTPSVDNLLLRLEKIESKFDIISDFEKGMNERMSDLSERIGEVRSMILERERSIDETNSDVEKIKDMVHEIEPSRYLVDLEKQKKSVLEVSAKVEKLEDVVKVTREDIKRSSDKLDKINGLESLSKFYSDLKKREAEVEDRVMVTRQLTSKVESIFVELSEKLADIDNLKKRVDSLQDLVEDVMKDSDHVMVKLEKIEKMGAVQKEIIGKEPIWLKDEMEGLRKEMEKRFFNKFENSDNALMDLRNELNLIKSKHVEIDGLKTMYETYKAAKTLELSEINDAIFELKKEINALRDNKQFRDNDLSKLGKAVTGSKLQFNSIKNEI